MNNIEESISHLQEGMSVLNTFPEEIETKRHILSSLGNLYFDARCYEEAIKIDRQLLTCCTTNKDKAIALNAISSYYSMTDQQDSAIVSQKKALKLAFASSDSSLIASSELNLSLKYYEQELDSALFHAHNAIRWLPKGKKRGNHEAAFSYLEEHIAIVDSLVTIEASTEVQQLIYKHNIKTQVREEQIKGERQLQLTISSFVFCFLIFAFTSVH